VHLRDLRTKTHFVHECRLLFSAVGVLVEPKEPNIPGRETFKGEIFHTARWRDDVDLRDKNIVVIGNGCGLKVPFDHLGNAMLTVCDFSFSFLSGSAAQMVPEITPKVKTLTQFIRTPHWLLERENTGYSPAMQWAFRYLPFFARFERFKMFMFMEKDEWRLFPGNETARRLRRAQEKHSSDFVTRVAPKKYHDLLVPDFEIACKVCRVELASTSRVTYCSLSSASSVRYGFCISQVTACPALTFNKGSYPGDYTNGHSDGYKVIPCGRDHFGNGIPDKQWAGALANSWARW
jgi:hypothetical protein